MIGKFQRSIVRDGLLIGPARLVTRGVVQTIGRANAALHGFNGLLPMGSHVSGLRRISIGPDFRSHGPVWIEAVEEYAERKYTPQISIGHSFRASDRLHITAVGKVTIGDNCLFGSSVFVGDHAHGNYGENNPSHPDTAPAQRPLGNQGDVTIGSNCWIGDNVTIIGPVKIGFGSIIAANSVVTSDIRPMSIAVGSPARVVKSFDETEQRWLRLDEVPFGR